MERVIIVGAGKVGFHLAKALAGSEYEVALVEIDAVRGKAVAEALEVRVFRGDGTEVGVLEDAEAGRAAYFVAATGNDADNLAACQLAKRFFGVPHAIARVIDPGNEKLFKRLGIDAVISTTALAARTIRNVLPSNGLRLTSIFDRGDVELAEVELEESSPVLGLPLSELRLPEDCLLVAVLRGEVVFLPRGKTVLEPGDRVFALARRRGTEALRRALAGGRR